MTITYHGVLAGAYKGRDVSARTLLTHASTDGGVTALCKRVKVDSLCDAEEQGPATCPTCAARVRSLEATSAQVAEYVTKFEREWRVMAKDVRFAFYGGVDSPERKAAYVTRRLDDYRAGLTRYLHRPECLELAEALDEVLNLRRTGAA